MKLDAADFSALEDPERLAVLEALVVGVIADGKINAMESRHFDELVLGLPWGFDNAVLRVMIQGAHERLAGLRTPIEIHDYLVQLAQRLPSESLREKVIFTMASLMHSDGDFNRAEKNVVGAFAVAFGIPSERVAAINDALLDGLARA
jgi:uncharacterized tellurite resistance protein B-like protein